VPVNGDRVSPTVEILVIGGGAYDSDAEDYSLSDNTGNQVEVEAQMLERAGVFKWVVVYRPKVALSSTVYDFFASYPAQGQDPASVATSFQVRQQGAATLEKPEASTWNTVLFSSAFDDLCESFVSATRVVIEQARDGDSPLWYEVELSNETNSERVTRAVVPGFGDGDGASITREFHEDFAVGCVAVTPVGSGGERGETFESCEATLCGTADAEEVDLETVWETLEECDGSAPGQPSPDASTPDQSSPDASSAGSSSGGSSSGGCSVGAMARPGLLWWALLAIVLVGPRVRRRANVR
jgi:hypothetical protein